jgi:outer membrane lipoprotein-sorting protein
MKSLHRLGALIAAITSLSLAFAAPSAAQNSGDQLLQRMSDQASHVRSYTADVHADISMKTFPYLSPSLDGQYYHKEPNKDKLIFTSGLPSIAKQFSKVYPHVESPSRWSAVYVVTNQGDADGTTSFKLVPRKHGRVDHIDAKVDDKTATIVSMKWNYIDGGYATLDQQYSTVNGSYIVSKQSGHVEVPHYTADVVSTYSNFKLNANIPDSVFKED